MNPESHLPEICQRVVCRLLLCVMLASGQVKSGAISGEHLHVFSHLAQSAGKVSTRWLNTCTGKSEVLPAKHQWFALPVPSECHQEVCTLQFSKPLFRETDCFTDGSGKAPCQNSGSNRIQPVFEGVAPGTVLHLYPDINRPESGHQYIVLTASEEKLSGDNRSLQGFPAPPLLINTESGMLFPDVIFPVVPLLNCSGNDVRFIYYPLFSVSGIPAYLLYLIMAGRYEVPPELMVSLDRCNTRMLKKTLFTGENEDVVGSDFRRNVYTHLSGLGDEQSLSDISGIFAYREEFNIRTGETSLLVYVNGRWQEATREERGWIRGIRHIEELDRIFGLDTSGALGFDTPNNSAYRTLMDRLIREEQQALESAPGTPQVPVHSPPVRHIPTYTLGEVTPSSTITPPGTTSVTSVTVSTSPRTLTPTPAPGAAEVAGRKANVATTTKPGRKGKSEEAQPAIYVKGILFTIDQPIQNNWKCKRCNQPFNGRVVQQIDTGDRLHEDCMEMPEDPSEKKKAYFTDNAITRDIADLLLTCSLCNEFTNKKFLTKKTDGQWQNNAADHAEAHMREYSCQECAFVSTAKGSEERKFELERHHPGHCLMPCQTCEFRFEKKYEKEHANGCPGRTVVCPVPDCQKSVDISQYFAHLSQEVQKISSDQCLLCPSCQQFQGTKGTLYVHVKDCCSASGQYICELEDGSGVACHTWFGDADSFLNHAMALHWTDYDKMLAFTGDISSLDRALVSLKGAMDAVGQLSSKESTAIGQHNVGLLQKMEELTNKVARIESENKRLVGLLEEHKSTAAGLDKTFQMASSDVTGSFNAVVPYTDSTDQSSFQRMKKSVSDMLDLLARHSTTIEELDLRQDCLDVKTVNGLLIWKIPDLKRRYREAMDGKIINLYSPPFYTSPHGYRMCIRFYPAGDGMGKNTHISLFFVIMRSEQDNLLPWPFQQKVRFTLINQENQKNSITEAFVPDPKSPSFQKPEKDINSAYGFPKFTKCSVLDEESFTKGDILYIKCKVDTTGLTSD